MLLEQFKTALADLDQRYKSACESLADDRTERELHAWLDKETPLPWSDPEHVTPDEWFFVTTLYGRMTLDAQRYHIRKFFAPLFVEAGKRDIRNFTPVLQGYDGLRYKWMQSRLCKMAAVLRERSMSMTDYVKHLRELEREAAPNNPCPALDAILQDHQATSGKTLSVFVRDCEGGNCFPIDSRVEKALTAYGLPTNERQLISLSLAFNKNPRELARLFYAAGG